MKAPAADLLVAFETHSVGGIRAILDAGFDASSEIDGKPAVMHLVEMYFRSDRFAACLRLMPERGAVLEDPRLAPVLLDDADAITAAVRVDAALLQQRTSLPSAFTPLNGTSLLHVAAEYGHVAAATALLALRAEVDARAATEAFGMNGHTPLFHTVNANGNRSAPVMRLLLAAGARADVRLQGITLGSRPRLGNDLFRPHACLLRTARAAAADAPRRARLRCQRGGTAARVRTRRSAARQRSQPLSWVVMPGLLVRDGSGCRRGASPCRGMDRAGLRR
jgi:hypothetical protein